MCLKVDDGYGSLQCTQLKDFSALYAEAAVKKIVAMTRVADA